MLGMPSSRCDGKETQVVMHDRGEPREHGCKQLMVAAGARKQETTTYFM